MKLNITQRSSEAGFLTVCILIALEDVSKQQLHTILQHTMTAKEDQIAGAKEKNLRLGKALTPERQLKLEKLERTIRDEFV